MLFVGKVSVCNNLRQYGFAYTLTSLHTVHPCSDSFKADLNQFIGVCKAVKGLRNARWGPLARVPMLLIPCATAKSCSRRTA
jgi:L-fucose isomerase-like protein